MDFPKNFFWGAATSAHQVEGGNRNDWTEWERANAARLARQAAKKQWPDFILKNNPNPLQKENYISGSACDHYNRFREDADIAKSLGHNAHRFSLEWSRIEPEEGKFNEKEIAHYREVIKALRERGLEPFVTLWHWTLPLWARERGGIEDPEFPKFFRRYVERVVSAFKDDVTYWMTLNEPTSVILNGYIRGVWPPQKKNAVAALRCFYVLARAHCVAFAVIHAAYPQAKVGFGNILVLYEPYRRWSPFDWFSVCIADFFSNRFFLMLTGAAHDYYAIQYYVHSRLAFPARVRNENTQTSDMGWGLYPEGICRLLKRFKTFRKPVYVTESGLADAKDEYRAWYIRETIRCIERAMREGVDVRGYFHWSLLDNFEWDKGFWPRFGLVEMDYTTMERRIRQSALEYKNSIEMGSHIV